MAHLLFLSHAGADTEKALRLAATIEASPAAREHGLEVWLDKRPDGDHRLRPGTPWQDQLEAAIKEQSTAFGLLLTREGARNWVRLEVRVALDRVIAEQRTGATYPFVPIIADDPGDVAHLPPFAQQYQGVRLTEDGKGLADLVRVTARLDAAQPVRLVAQPFMGLEAFEAKDAALFFGRREETKPLVDRLRTTNLVLVTGDSGSGKSSLVKASLIPAFREGALADPLGRRPEPGQWHVIEMRPGTDPFEGLVEGAQRAATTAGIAPEMIFALGAAIRTREPGAIRDALRQSGSPNASLLLVVDQFEELWTLTLDDSKRHDFLAALLALVPEGDLARRVVGTMRRDYYHLHTDDEHLRDRLAANGNAGRFLLGAMAPESLRDIVEKPLLLAGESETRAAALADEVVKDVAGEPGNLALVEMALHESWERRHESRGDLALAYQRLDRLEGALARAAEEVFWNPSNDPKKLTQAERPIAEALFMRLVRGGDAGGATRRPVAFDELEEPARAVARKLATPACRRLLVLRDHSGAGSQEDTITVELAHEQLVTQWPDYRFWLRGTAATRHIADPEREADKRTFDRLMGAAANWSKRGCNDEDLARGGDLSDFQWMCRTANRYRWLSPTERQFLDKSSAAGRAAEQDRQRQLNTLRQLAITRRRQTWGVALAALSLSITAGLFLWQWREADAAKIEARGQKAVAEVSSQRAMAQLTKAMRIESRRLANLSLQTTERGDAVTGLLLTLEALPKNFKSPERPIVSELVTPLRKSLMEQREIVDLHNDTPVTSAAFSPVGTSIATGLESGAIRLWSADGRGIPIELRGHDGQINALAFSPDGTHLASASRDGTARVWLVGSGTPVCQLKVGATVIGTGFSPDGKRLFTISTDGSARIWRTDGHGEGVAVRGYDGVARDLTFMPNGIRVLTISKTIAQVWTPYSSSEPIKLRGHETDIRYAAFSPDGSRVLTLSRDDTARIWQVDGRGASIVLRGHDDIVTSAAFSPDSSQVVTASMDNTARIWQIDGAGTPIILRGHDAPLSSATFSTDGLHVITSSWDGTARIWQVSASKEIVTLWGHEDWVTQAAFSPDGSKLVTASLDKTARIWSLNETEKPIILTGHDGALTSVAFGPDNSRVVTASLDKTARIWRVDRSGVSIVLRGHEGGLTSAKFSPDGQRVVTASWDRTARIWRSDGLSIPIVLRGHSGPITSASFSPDGRRVITTSMDRTARVWASDDGRELPQYIVYARYGGLASFNTDNSIRTLSLINATGDLDQPITYPYPKDLLNRTTIRDIVDPNGKLYVSHVDNVAEIFQFDGRPPSITLRGHTAPILFAIFSPDGTKIVTTSADGSARIWPLIGTIEQLATYARSLRLPRQLSEYQKKQYFIVDDW